MTSPLRASLLAALLSPLAAGLIVNAVTPDTLRLAPPLIVSEAEIDAAVDILGTVLAARLSESGS